MPKIRQLNEIDITVERFLEACSITELHEVELLINSPHFQRKMDEHIDHQNEINLLTQNK